MACPPTNVKFQLRRSTGDKWTATNPILQEGEPGWDITANRLKIGDGKTRWNSLKYLTDGNLGVGPSGDVGPTGAQGTIGISGLPGMYGPRGRDGAKGRDGRDGLPGRDGKDGNDGQPGQDGTRIFIISEEVEDISMLTSMILAKYGIFPKLYDIVFYSINNTIYELV